MNIFHKYLSLEELIARMDKVDHDLTITIQCSSIFHDRRAISAILTTVENLDDAIEQETVFVQFIGGEPRAKLLRDIRSKLITELDSMLDRPDTIPMYELEMVLQDFNNRVNAVVFQQAA